MSDDLELDLPLTGAQALAGHEFALTLSRRVLEGAQWTLKDETLRLRTPAGVAPRTILRLAGMGHAQADGSTGELRVRLLIDEPEHAQELRLSPGDAARGVSRAVNTVSGRVVVHTPAGVTNGMMLKHANLCLRIAVDPLLPDSQAAVRGVDPGRRWAMGGGLALALYGFIGAFVLPFSELGAPAVFIDGRFFVLGFGGLAIALLGMVPMRPGALNGRGKAVALAGAAAFLVAVCLATWGLILLLERFGYFLRF